ncbi:MAG: hypothetical protein ABH956_03105 [Candidatus Nealsonbacteria bacterium]
MDNQNKENITLLKSTIKEEEMVVLPLEKLKKLEKENLEFHLAFEAILSGEIELRDKKTRSFKEFLKSDFFQHAKN